MPLSPQLWQTFFTQLNATESKENSIPLVLWLLSHPDGIPLSQVSSAHLRKFGAWRTQRHLDWVRMGKNAVKPTQTFFKAFAGINPDDARRLHRQHNGFCEILRQLQHPVCPVHILAILSWIACRSTHEPVPLSTPTLRRIAFSGRSLNPTWLMNHIASLRLLKRDPGMRRDLGTFTLTTAGRRVLGLPLLPRHA